MAKLYVSLTTVEIDINNIAPIHTSSIGTETRLRSSVIMEHYEQITVKVA